MWKLDANEDVGGKDRRKKKKRQQQDFTEGAYSDDMEGVKWQGWDSGGRYEGGAIRHAKRGRTNISRPSMSDSPGGGGYLPWR